MRALFISKSITLHEHSSLDKYFTELAKIDLISPEEEATLVQKIRQGDKTALTRLTRSNLRFVVSVAKQYQNRGLTLGDLINEGNIGLITAVKRFDETRGFKFISYAVWWIRQAILAAIAAQVRLVHLPYNSVALMSKLFKAAENLEQQFGRKPTSAELAEYMGLSTRQVCALFCQSGKSVSIDAPFDHATEATLLDVLEDREPSPDDAVLYESVKQEIGYALRVLAPREREIVILFFGLAAGPLLSLEEIAKKFDLSIEHTRRLKDSALIRLRNCSNATALRSCLN